MTRILLILLTLLCTGTLSAGHKTAKLQFQSTVFDFGSISADTEKVVHDYVFINPADEPVAILSVSTGCGCARPEYPVEPIAPGASGKITITYLVKGQAGEVNRDIKVRYRGATASSSERTTLRCRGVITP